MCKPHETKVGIYVRLSNDDERSGESVSIENQKMLLTKYADEKGWTDVRTYVDDGYSGTNQNRPAFQRMLCDAENKAIDVILVKDAYVKYELKFFEVILNGATTV